MDPASTIWAGLIDGSAAPRPSRFYRPRPDPTIGPGVAESSKATANAPSAAPPEPDLPSLPGDKERRAATVGQSSRDGKPWPMDDLIPTQPDPPAHPILSEASSVLPVTRRDPEVIQMDIKGAGLEAHQVTILPTDGAAACNRKAERVGDLLDTGHTLAAHLGLFQGVPSQHTPDSLAIEAMAPEEKRAWCWWAQHEATEAGSAARQMPPLNIDTDRAAVPPTAPGNKSSVAQKTPALELLYGLPPGTLSAEHVAFFLRPSNAASVPILTAALRVIKSRQHCSSAAGLGALYVDPRLKIEIEALHEFKLHLSARHATLFARDGVGIGYAGTIIERIEARVAFLGRALQPLKQKDIIKKQASQLRRPVWEA